MSHKTVNKEDTPSNRDGNLRKVQPSGFLGFVFDYGPAKKLEEGRV